MAAAILDLPPLLPTMHHNSRTSLCRWLPGTGYTRECACLLSIEFEPEGGFQYYAPGLPSLSIAQCGAKQFRIS